MKRLVQAMRTMLAVFHLYHRMYQRPYWYTTPTALQRLSSRRYH